MSVSTYVADLMLNTLRGVPFAFDQQLYAALFTSVPGVDADPSGHEVAGGGYARVAITLAAPSGGYASAGTVTFPIATGLWSTINYVGLCDALSGGQVLAADAVTPTTVLQNQTFSINLLRARVL